MVRFSRVSQPGTNILTRSQLDAHFVRYWQLLSEGTKVTSQIVPKDSTPEIKWENYFTGVTHFSSEGDGDGFEPFLDKIIPRTRVLFDAMRQYIHDVPHPLIALEGRRQHYATRHR